MTPAWLMNVAQTTNAKKGPAKEYNAYKDFSDIELDTQVIASAMVHFSMEKMEGITYIVETQIQSVNPISNYSKIKNFNRTEHIEWKM